jgi:hypothetical protein
MNDNEREMDLALAEAEQENRLLRARNERLERELAGQVALDKMADNARELGLDYEPVPVQEKNQSPYPEYDRGFSNGWDRGFAAAQPAPVKTYHDGKPWPVAPVPDGPYSAPIKELWPVAPKPWVNLTDEDVKEIREQCDSIVTLHAIKAIEAKLKEKNT